MATPQVAGVVALLWSYKPELIGQIDETIAIISQSAVPKKSKQSCEGFPGGKIPNAATGYGLLDAFKALTSH